MSLITSIVQLFSLLKSNTIIPILFGTLILMIIFLMYYVFKLLDLLKNSINEYKNINNISKKLDEINSFISILGNNQFIINDSLNDIKDYLETVYQKKNISQQSKSHLISKDIKIEKDD